MSQNKISSPQQDHAIALIEVLSLDRSSRRWRLFFLVLLLLWLSQMLWFRGGDSVEVSQPHIAVVDVKSVMKSTEEPWYQSLLRVYESPHSQALLLRVSSPGGVVHVADAGYRLLKRIKQRMPVITVVDQQAASAAYLLASQSDYILAQETSIVGSIGVLSSVVVLKGLLEKIGIEYVPSKQIQTITDIPFMGLTPFIKRYLYQTGEDSYRWFQAVVKQGRGLSFTQLSKVIDGKVFLGREAIDLGLVDALGTEWDAQRWINHRLSSQSPLAVHYYPG